MWSFNIDSQNYPLGCRARSVLCKLPLLTSASLLLYEQKMANWPVWTIGASSTRVRAGSRYRPGMAAELGYAAQLGGINSFCQIRLHSNSGGDCIGHEQHGGQRFQRISHETAGQSNRSYGRGRLKSTALQCPISGGVCQLPCRKLIAPPSPLERREPDPARTALPKQSIQLCDQCWIL